VASRWRRAAVVSAALAVLGAAGASAAAAGSHGSKVAASRRRLNVVVILSDDERLDGGTVMKNVRHLLAAHGVTFSDYHVTTSECGPSRASILLGQYSHHTGVLDNFGPHSFPAFDQNSDLAVWLHSSGYRTALIGKYLNDYTLYGHNEIPPGWDDFQAMDSVPMEEYYNYTVNDNGRLEHYGTAPSDYSTTVLTNKAVRFIKRAHSPFFLYFAPIAPHLPAIPAKQDQNKLVDLAPLHSPAFNEADIGDKPWRAWHADMLNAAAQLYQGDVRRRQLESLYALDRSVKQIVDTLKQRHVLDHTVILYSSDNGFLWGEHRLGGKLWPYEESTHVPLVVRTPWATKGIVDSEPILNIDLAPTISAFAGIDPPKREDGRSFVPFLHQRAIPSWRKAYMIEYLGRNQLTVGGPPPYYAVHTRRYLYVEYLNGWRELYDLRTDPWELDNVAQSPRYAQIKASLHTELLALESSPGETS
jgi:N-acetylglucosamine-6-sulfatase